jgi:hypothetical protein
MTDTDDSNTDRWFKLVQTLSVVVGVVISIWTVSDTRKKEAEARIEASKTENFERQKYADQKQADAYKAQIEAARPFLELRQKRYLEAAHAAGILAEPSLHTQKELVDARKQFYELYWADLSLVEETDVAVAMENFSMTLRSSPRTEPQDKSLALAHALGDSLTRSWGVASTKTGDLPRPHILHVPSAPITIPPNQ